MSTQNIQNKINAIPPGTNTNKVSRASILAVFNAIKAYLDGFDEVDNTSDANKPISDAVNQALSDLAQDIANNTDAETFTGKGINRFIHGNNSFAVTVFNGDCNNISKAGPYYIQSNAAHKPVQGAGYLYHHASSSVGWSRQTYVQYDVAGFVWCRNQHANIWSDWFILNLELSKYTSSSRNLLISDIGNIIECEGSTNIVITVPTEINIGDIHRNQIVKISRNGAGHVTIVQATGVIIKSKGGMTSIAEHSMVGLRYRGNNNWQLIGGLEE